MLKWDVLAVVDSTVLTCQCVVSADNDKVIITLSLGVPACDHAKVDSWCDAGCSICRKVFQPLVCTSRSTLH